MSASTQNVRGLDGSLLNGLAFLSFHQLDDGVWVVGDWRRNTYRLPSASAGLQLRCRALRTWALVPLVGALAAALGAPQIAIAASAGGAFGLVVGLAGQRAARFPAAGLRVARAEARYQARGLLVAVAAALLAVVGWVLGATGHAGGTGLRWLGLGAAAGLVLCCGMLVGGAILHARRRPAEPLGARR